MYSKKPISRNAEPSSDAPQSKQTKHPITVDCERHSSAEWMCADEGTLCGQQCSHN